MLTVYNYREVSSAFGVGITTSETFEGLELYDGKLSRTVLKGLRLASSCLPTV